MASLESEILKYFLTQGPAFVILVGVLYWVLKSNKEREDKYITIVTNILPQQTEALTKLSDKIEKCPTVQAKNNE